MIVLAILVTIATIAWPRVARQLQLIGPRESAIELKSVMQEAREEAMRTGEPWVLRIERGSAKYEYGPTAAFRAREEKEFSGAPNSATDVFESLGLDATSTDASSTPIDASPDPQQAIGGRRDSALRPTSRDEEIRSQELPPGMVFDDGFAHSTQEVNSVRSTAAVPQQPQVNPLLNNHQTNNLTANIPQSQQFPANPLAPAPLNTPPLNPLQAITAVPPNNWKYAVIFQPDGRSTESEVRIKESATEAKIRLRVRRITGGITIDKVERKKAQTVIDPTNALIEDGLPPELMDPSRQVAPNQQMMPGQVPTYPTTQDARQQFPRQLP